MLLHTVYSQKYMENGNCGRTIDWEGWTIDSYPDCHSVAVIHWSVEFQAVASKWQSGQLFIVQNQNKVKVNMTANQ